MLMCDSENGGPDDEQDDQNDQNDQAEHQEYDQTVEGPEAQLARLEVELDEAWTRVIKQLHDSLQPEDLTRELFTFEEIRTYNLRQRRKRSEA